MDEKDDKDLDSVEETGDDTKDSDESKKSKDNNNKNKDNTPSKSNKTPDDNSEDDEDFDDNTESDVEEKTYLHDSHKLISKLNNLHQVVSDIYLQDLVLGAEVGDHADIIDLIDSILTSLSKYKNMTKTEKENIDKDKLDEVLKSDLNKINDFVKNITN